MKKGRGFKQGIFKPNNPAKYNGSLPIIYRSSYELIFFRWLDSNPRVVCWGSESVIIPYQDPLSPVKKLRRYFVDNSVTIRNDKGEHKKYLIEIKPYCQTIPPQVKRHTKSTPRQQATYIKNIAKWKAAVEWCDKKGDVKFMLITEKELSSLRI
jgi:hypothetical protein